ncbi:MAG: hypothetical protein HY659_04825 [Rhizobiales bacterium]|nr:hypothetical protein [Hyphomicrobiales bacterium]
MSDTDLTSNIPAKHAAGIGLATMAWADFEFDIDYTIWELLSTQQALAACVTAQMISPIPKLNALQSLVRLYQFGEELENRISQFSGSIGGLVERRNRIVHDKRIWYPDTGTVKRIQVTAKSRLTLGAQPESFDDLAVFASDVVGAHNKFNEIMDAIFEALHVFAKLPEAQKPPLPRIIRRQTSATPTNETN